MAKLRLRRFGMSFRPLPGCPMAARYCRSSHTLNSPRLSLSRKGKPPCSTSSRTISSVGWSPHLFFSGMDRSSMKTVMRFPPGGPKLRPPRLSSSASTAFRHMKGVVAEEKLMRFTACLSAPSVRRNMSAVEVLAVPSAPTRSTGLRRLCSFCRRKPARVESMVGTRRLEKSSRSGAEGRAGAGYVQAGGRQRSQASDRACT